MASEHPTFTRFMQAAKLLKGLSDQADIARAIDVLDQHITNWKKRGLPKPKIMDLAEWLGCDPYWLRDGYGEMKPMSYTMTRQQTIVLKAMENMDPRDQDKMVKISDTFAEPEGNGGEKPHKPTSAATQ